MKPTTDGTEGIDQQKTRLRTRMCAAPGDHCGETGNLHPYRITISRFNKKKLREAEHRTWRDVGSKGGSPGKVAKTELQIDPGIPGISIGEYLGYGATAPPCSWSTNHTRR